MATGQFHQPPRAGRIAPLAGNRFLSVPSDPRADLLGRCLLAR
jgi:hypothetical protein